MVQEQLYVWFLVLVFFQMSRHETAASSLSFSLTHTPAFTLETQKHIHDLKSFHTQ